MCGIVGFSRVARAELDRARLDRMTRSLEHRGPDGDGFHLDSDIALGHRRLSIIDVEGGDQPIYNRDGSLVIVFNGEIYNYKELREELVRDGCEFTTSSDTEVILHLYQEYGEKCLSRLDGMFAFAIWDGRARKLFIARDRLGEKPLYFQSIGNSILFASELKSILAAGLTEREIDVSSMDDYLAYGYVPAPKTIFQSVQKLPAAHYLTWQGGVVSTQKYWSAQREAITTLSYADATKCLLELIENSIRIRLRSDVPVGAFLSGGVDSSLVALLAAREYRGSLTTFNVSFGESEVDESAYARIAAKVAGTDHHEIRVSALDLNEIPNLVCQFDEPFADPSSLPTYFVTREASRHKKVCLSGDAGDELFGGYSRYLPEPFESVLSELPLEFGRSLLSKIASVYPESYRGKGWLSRMSTSGAARYQHKNGVFTPEERARLFRPEYRSIIDQSAYLYAPYFSEGNDSSCTPSSYMLADQNSYLAEDILVKVDRASMLNSLEVRVPLLDHKIVEFANSLPLQYKIGGGEQKRILRDVARALLPAQLIDRPKQGFGLPLQRWFQDAENKRVLTDVLLTSDSESKQFLDADYISALLRTHRRGGRDFGARIWALYWLELWLRNCRAETK